MQHEMAELPRLAEADGVFFITLAKGDRASVATTIERLIDLLDAMEPDPDLEDGGDAEPWLGWCGQSQKQYGGRDDREEACEGEGDWSELEPTMGWQNFGSQAHLEATLGLDECEQENEHGGDVQDEPHDDIGDAEPFLGWGEQCSQGPKIGVGLKHDAAVQCLDMALDAGDTNPHYGGHLDFDGTGYREANELLRAKGLEGVRVSPGLWW